MHESEIALLKRKRAHDQTYIHIVGHQHAATLRKLYQEGKLTVEEVKHQSCWPSKREVDFGDPESTRTYRERLYVVLQGDYTIKVVVEDGEMTYGNFRNIRCTFYLVGEWWHFQPFLKAIEAGWVQFTQRLVDNEILADLEERRKKIAQRVLGGSYPKELLERN